MQRDNERPQQKIVFHVLRQRKRISYVDIHSFPVAQGNGNTLTLNDFPFVPVVLRSF
jgi:hypothetical protein